VSKFKTILLLLAILCSPALASTPVRAESVPAFVQEIRNAAMKAGVSPHTIELSLNNFHPLAHVIELDQKQPESTITFEDYYERTATTGRIEKGQAMLAQEGPLLEHIYATYGVEPSILVSLWGMESSFGASQGNYSVIQSLATLSYEGRRHDFFKGELIKAMQIVDEGDVSYQDMIGSWAGAMGQVQFMPSTFQTYAVDFTGDGKRDIWHSDADALASAANYLSQLGWKTGEKWGREIALPANFDSSLAGRDKMQPVEIWKRMGIKTIDGSAVPEAGIDAAVVLPDGEGGRAFLVYNNFNIIMRWNRSTFFAATVGLMADEMGNLQ
jgi:membrane-bound lytic murein transglycosylase B